MANFVERLDPTTTHATGNHRFSEMWVMTRPLGEGGSNFTLPTAFLRFEKKLFFLYLSEYLPTLFQLQGLTTRLQFPQVFQKRQFTFLRIVEKIEFIIIERQ